MRLNTLTPIGILIILLALVTGCAVDLDIARPGESLKFRLKPENRPADQVSTDPMTAR